MMKLPRSITRVSFLLLYGALILAGSVEAQFPATFTYQGRPMDGSLPANGQYELTFGLHGTATGGSPLVVQTNAPVEVVDGLFTVVLDYTDVAFIGFDRWLEIGVRTNGSTEAHTLLSPRQAITATPYAIHAGSVNASGIIGQVTDSQIATVLSVPRTFNHPANQFTGTFTGSFFGNGAGLTNLNVGSVSGFLPANGLSGFYSNILGLTNTANQFYGTFTGIGSGLTNVNASTLEGRGSDGFWKVGGNAGVTGSEFIGTTDFQSLRFRVEGFEALRMVPTGGIPNIVGGFSLNPEGLGASIGGGRGHQATNNFVTIAGGQENKADGQYVAIGGGNGNFAKGAAATISGGNANISSGNTSTIGGGLGNSALDIHTTVGGGVGNRAIGFGSTIGGGELNVTDDLYSTVPGGRQNEALGPYSFAAGRRARALHGGTFVWADNTDEDFNSGGINQFLIRASGGVGINTANTVGNGLTVDGAVNATSFVGDGSGLTGLTFTSLGGVLPSAGLSGVYENFVWMTNTANQFYGTFNGVGAGLTNVNASFLDGLQSGDFWQLQGNAGTTPGTHFIGTTDNKALQFKVNNARALNIQAGNADGTGAPNIAAGFAGNAFNQNRRGAVIAGGGESGSPNTTGNNFTTVSGGSGNSASGEYSVVGGGLENSSTHNFATVTGGRANLANAAGATVGGGEANTASGQASAIVGGLDNLASGSRSFVGGGEDNQSTTNFATVGGGFFNLATGHGSTISGGQSNAASTNDTVVAGGTSNTASGLQGTVSGGSLNVASGHRCTVSGGSQNISSGDATTIGGGTFNVAQTNHATVAGGFMNQATNELATVGGGERNIAGGVHATVPGGLDNAALGELSQASGHRAKALHQGAYVWADSQTLDFGSSADDQYLIRAQGGVGINPTNTAGHALVVNGSVNAASFAGDGSGLVNIPVASIVGLTNGSGGTVTDLDASVITSGILENARLSTNVARSATVWSRTGNVATNPGADFVGTTDNQRLDFRVNNQTALRLVPNGTGIPSLAGGYSGNQIGASVDGAVISGSGNSSQPNSIQAFYAL